jgi:hypothetical protein
MHRVQLLSGTTVKIIPTALSVLRSSGADWWSLDAEFMNRLFARLEPVSVASIRWAVSPVGGPAGTFSG